MNKYIDAEKIEKVVCSVCSIKLNGGKCSGCDTLRAIQSIQKADVAEVKHGRWIIHIDDLFPVESTMECNLCHEEQPLGCDDNYCPNCGARMDEVKE